MHPPIGGGVSTDFKSSNRIKISQLVQILLHFYWFRAPHPPGGWEWVEWVPGGLGMMLGPSRQCGHDGDNTGMTWGPRGQHGVETTETTETTGHGDHMGTFWGLWGWHGDDGDDTGMMGMTWGWWRQRGDHRDNEITKNAITFEQIKIIELRLKIWDPWTFTHTCRLQLMCRWGVSYPKWHFYPKSAPVTLEKIFFLFLHRIPLDHI